MSRRFAVTDIHLEINEVEAFKNDRYEGLVIKWISDIGWGEYTIYKTENGWCADAETMDSNEDRAFITELMRLFIESLNIM